MILYKCKHNYVTDINKQYTDDSESYIYSWSIQFVTQKSWSYSWKRKSFRHWKDATHVERMRSCRKLQFASSHMRKIILLKITFIVKWFNWNDHKYQCIIDAILRHNYKRLSKISNNNRSDFHDRWHYESINIMQNQQKNEKLLKSFIDTDNYRFQNLQRVSMKIALQLKNNEWKEVHQYSERTNVKITVESWDKMSMYKWVH